MAEAIGAFQASGTESIGAFEPTPSASYTPDLEADDSAYTTIPEPTIGRKVYVDATGGSDSNDGLSTGAPKQTLSAGAALIRTGYDDQLLLKRGETWAEEINQTASGVSASAPIIYGTYGTGARPKVEKFRCGGTSTPTNYFQIHGWHFSQTTRKIAIELLTGGTGVRIEDVYIDNTCRHGFVLQGVDNNWQDVVVHRCVVHNVHDKDDASHHQGLYAQLVDGLTISECYFDKNGWSDDVGDVDDRDIYKHNIYIQGDCTDVTVSKLWSSRGSSHGIQHRPGGVLEDSTFFNSAINVWMSSNETGVSRYLRRNVIVEASDVDGSTARGWGIETKGGETLDCSYNIIAHITLGTNPYSISVQGSSSSSAMSFRKNISYKAGKEWQFPSGDSNITLADNDIQEPGGGEVVSSYSGNFASVSGNRYYTSAADGSRFLYGGVNVTDASWKSSVSDSGSTLTDLSGAYTDPEKDMDDYAVSIGLADADALLTQIRTQRKGNWDLNLTPDRINAYFRANFDMIPAPSDLTATKDSLDVGLEWDAIPEASGYIIERRTDGGSWEQIGSA